MNRSELVANARRLAMVYRGLRDINHLEKEKLYALKFQYPEIHKMALRINRDQFNKKKRN